MQAGRLRYVSRNNYLPEVNVHGAVLDATPAPDAEQLAVVVHGITEFVHEALTSALLLAGAGIVARGMEREERIHAGIPGSQPAPVLVEGFIRHVEAVAGRAKVGAYPAAEASLRRRIPKVRLERSGKLFGDALEVHLLDLRSGFLNNALLLANLVLAGVSCETGELVEELFAFRRYRLEEIALAQVGEEDVGTLRAGGAAAYGSAEARVLGA